MLRKIFKIDGHAKISNKSLYDGLPKITDTIRVRRLQLAGHVFRDKKKIMKIRRTVVSQSCDERTDERGQNHRSLRSTNEDQK